MNDVIITQYTGLLDRHSKEVYEGDIVKTPSGIFPVKWLEGCFFLKIPMCDTSTMDREILGNIYEHPHLLEGRHA